MQLLMLLAAVLVGAVIMMVIARANELFYVSIRDGRCIVVRGHVPPSLLRELREVVRLSGVRRGKVRAVKDGGQPRLFVEGLDDRVAQRLRNSFGARGFGRMTASGSAAASGSSSRNLGQLLGLAWLAWWLTPRD